MLTSEQMARIQNEIVLGQPPSEATNTPEGLQFRQQIEANVKQAMSQGLTPTAPFEMPD